MSCKMKPDRVKDHQCCSLMNSNKKAGLELKKSYLYKNKIQDIYSKTGYLHSSPAKPIFLKFHWNAELETTLPTLQESYFSQVRKEITHSRFLQSQRISSLTLVASSCIHRTDFILEYRRVHNKPHSKQHDQQNALMALGSLETMARALTSVKAGLATRRET